MTFTSLGRLTATVLIVLKSATLTLAQPADPVITRLVELHNQERAKEDLPPLTLNPKLTEAAQLHAEDMAQHLKMSHEGSDGSNPGERLERQGYSYRGYGENVAFSQRTPEAVMRAWMNSPPHRANILNPFTEIGVGVAQGRDRKRYWCVTFGLPRPSEPPRRDPGQEPPRRDPGQEPAHLTEALNRERDQADRPRLTVSTRLDAIAARLVRDVAEQRSNHPDQPLQLDLAGAIQQEHYRPRQLSVSFALGQPTAEAVVRTLTDSPSEKKNLLGDFTEVGTGFATAKDGTPIWMVVYGIPLTE